MTEPIRIGCQFGPFKGRTAFLDTARRLEGSGFDVATFPDHFGGWGSVWPSITAAAAVTSTLALGTLTINNDLWNPVVLARDAVTTDHLTDGRLELGIGAGWRTGDYEITGIDKAPAGVRIARLAEALEIVRGYFRPGPFSRVGDYYDVDIPDDRLRPVRDSGIPIFIGGGGRKILRLAAQQADIIGVHINLKAGQFTIGKGAADADQGVVESAMEERLSWIQADGGERVRTIPLQLFFMEVREGAHANIAAEPIAATFGISTDEVIASPYFLVGTAAEMADKIRTVQQRTGVTYFTCREDHIDTMSSVIELLHH
jgi:probable F420-dependent oxidoreductase